MSRRAGEVAVCIVGMTAVGIEAARVLSACPSVRVLVMDIDAQWKRGLRAGEYQRREEVTPLLERRSVQLAPTAGECDAVGQWGCLSAILSFCLTVTWDFHDSARSYRPVRRSRQGLCHA